MAGAVLNADKAGAHLFNVSATSKWTVAMALNYTIDALASFFGSSDITVYSSYNMVMYNYYMPASARESYQPIFENYGFVPVCASAASDNPTASEEGYDYYYFLPSETEGTYILIDYYWVSATVQEQAACGLQVYISTYTPSTGE